MSPSPLFLRIEMRRRKLSGDAMQPKTLPIEEILSDAIDLVDADARRQFVEAACGGDCALRHRVERLIENHFRAGRFLETPAVVPAADAGTAMIEGSRMVIGPYKLLEQIGEGGFGIVFMAEQQQPVRRMVALKIIKPGMDTRQVIARFEAERQALALMDHPNIAKVLDAGATDSGRPYFVMELIKGIPITDYCDENRLPPRERLRLFVCVCQAVQHAHQKGIIHRDLKPSNILVTLHDGTPVAKVIDFGIAKATGQQLTERTLFTNFAQLMGTPLYMSPEQAALGGLDIDTRCDVYALGVLLYQLLTGTTPFTEEQLRQAGYDELRRLIREEEPPRPSTRLSTLGQAGATVSARRQCQWQQLCVLVRGELDWIVMKALAKDRNQRYESASALAADVERYLLDEPVQACPPSRRYLLGKFLRRHRTGLMTAAALLLATVLCAAGAGWAVLERVTWQAEMERQRRDTELAVAADLKEATSWEDQKDWPRALIVLERAKVRLSVVHLEWMLKQVERRLLMTRDRGNVEASFARWVEARRLLERRPNLPAPPEYKMLLYSNQEFDEAYALYQRAVELNPEDVVSRHELSNVLFLQWKLPEAARECRTALLHKPGFASAYSTLGVILRAQGNVSEADEANRKAKELNEGMAEANAAHLLMCLGHFAEACDAAQRGQDHGVSTWVCSRAAAHWLELDRRLAQMLRANLQPGEASERLELAHLCQLPCRQFYAAAARCYREIFAADPELVGERRAGIRFRAARAAAQAGCGQGNDAADLSPSERAGLRKQALAWLQAELTGWNMELKYEPALEGVIYETRRWRLDSRLNCVRSEEALARLPEAERDKWQELWRAVDSLERHWQEAAVATKPGTHRAGDSDRLRSHLPLVGAERNFVRCWLILSEPVSYVGQDGTQALNQHLIPGEAQLKPRAGDRLQVNGEALTWKEHYSPELHIDFENIYGAPCDYQLTYALCYIHADTNRDDLLLRVGSDDQAKVYLNGQEIYRSEKTRGLAIDEDEVPISLRQGTNVLLFKVVNVRSGWTGSLHFVAKDGRPAKGIRFGLQPE